MRSKPTKPTPRRARPAGLAGDTSFGWLVFTNQRTGSTKKDSVQITVSAKTAEGTVLNAPATGTYTGCPRGASTLLQMPSTWVNIVEVEVFVRSTDSEPMPMGRCKVTTTPEAPGIFAICTLGAYSDATTNDFQVQLVTAVTAQINNSVVQ